jgi:hypothetical protein
MGMGKRSTRRRGTLRSRLDALEDRQQCRGMLVLYAEGPGGERWACTGDGRILTGAQAEALFQVARQRGDSFAHVADVDLPLILGVVPHATEFSGRTDAHGGVASLKMALTPDPHDVEAPSNC